MGRILAIDYGKKRTGIAATDPLQIIANGLTTVDTHLLRNFLKDYCTKEEVERVIIGLPKNLDDSDTDPATQLFRRTFAAAGQFLVALVEGTEPVQEEGGPLEISTLPQDGWLEPPPRSHQAPHIPWNMVPSVVTPRPGMEVVVVGGTPRAVAARPSLSAKYLSVPRRKPSAPSTVCSIRAISAPFSYTVIV